MRHRLAHRKLGRTTNHRISLLRNLAAALFLHERIRTTLAKAKELRPFAEKLITLSKKDSVHARRRALRVMPRKDAVNKLFRELSARFAERPGGYTRILKLGPRPGDGAPMAIIELVDYVFSGAEAPAEGKSRKVKAKPETSEAKGEQPSAEGEEVEAKPRRRGKKKKTATSKKKAATKASGKKKTSKKGSTRKKKKGS